jgi:hypothetical protein
MDTASHLAPPCKRATHSCPSGYYGDPPSECGRGPKAVQKYRQRIPDAFQNQQVSSPFPISHGPFRVKLTILFLFVMTLAGHPVKAQSPAPAGNSDANIPRLFIDPSSSNVSFGKAYLTVDPLVHKGKLYVGAYQLTVEPYFFMSEKGILELEAPDDALHQLLGGTAEAFTGKASNNKQGAPKVITGKITPSTKKQGSVTFSVTTDNGRMIFNTSYHFGE